VLSTSGKFPELRGQFLEVRLDLCSQSLAQNFAMLRFR